MANQKKEEDSKERGLLCTGEMVTRFNLGPAFSDSPCPKSGDVLVPEAEATQRTITLSVARSEGDKERLRRRRERLQEEYLANAERARRKTADTG